MTNIVPLEMIKKTKFYIWVKNLIKNNDVFFVIGSIIVFYLINNLIWLRNNHYPSGPDEFHHLTIGLDYCRLFAAHFKDIFNNPISCEWIWPPFYYIISGALSIFLGQSYISLVMGNLFYLTILLFSVYSIGIKLFDKKTGILAAIFISMYPLVFRYSRYYNPEFGLMAMVSLSICFLIYSDYFKCRKFSVLLGVSLGLGMLTKWTFILFLIGPLINVFLKAGIFREKQKILNFSFFLIPATLISFSWYLFAPWDVLTQELSSFFSLFTHYKYGKVDLDVISLPLFQPEAFFRFLQLLINPGISLLFFVIFLASLLPWSFKSKNKITLILWAVVPYCLLSLSSYKEGRYMLSALPTVALVSAAGLQAMSFKKIHFLLRRDLYLILILFGLLQFFSISFKYNPYGDFFRKTPAGIMGVLYASPTEHHKWAYGPPYKKDWKMDEIAERIALHCRELPSLTIGIICYDEYAGEFFNYPAWLNYYLVKKNINKANIVSLLSNRVQLSHFLDYSDEINCIIFISFASEKILSPKFANLQWQLLPVLTRGLPALQVKKGAPLEILRDFISKMDSQFGLLDTIKLPEGYSAYIYKKK